MPKDSLWVHDRPEEDLFTVDRRIFTDPDLYELELKYIWEGSWLYLAHDSQLPNKHDFFTTHMGRQPVVLIRGEDERIRCFINACAHRGASLCRTARGNRKFLVCSYHGWTYDSAGNNVAVKDVESGGYPQAFLGQSHNLTQIACLDTYRGFIFGSLNPNVPDLKTHLGEAAIFLDLIARSGPEGVEVLPGVGTYTQVGNWKMLPENSMEAYHFPSVHASYLGLLARSGNDSKAKLQRPHAGKPFLKQPAGWYDLGRGHTLMWIEYPAPQNRPAWNHSRELAARLGQTRADWLLLRQRNLLLYPNLLLIDSVAPQIRVYRPLSVERTRVHSFCLGTVNEPTAERGRRVHQFEDFFNASGLATPDDLTLFRECQIGLKGHQRSDTLGYQRGMANRATTPDALGQMLGLNPIACGFDFRDETLHHSQYREWQRLMAPGRVRPASG